MNDLEPLQSFPPVPEITVPELENQPSLPPTPSDSILRRIFLGDDGLRAGWSLFCFLLFILLIIFLGGLIAGVLHLLPKSSAAVDSQQMSPRSAIISDGIQFVTIALAAFLMSLIERRPFTRYGITFKRAIPDFLMGLVWGFVALSFLIGLLFLTHSIAFDGFALHGSIAYSYAAKWFLGFLLVGFFEEFLTRGYIQYTIARGVAGIVRAFDPLNRHAHAWGFWVAAGLFSCAFFMALHLANKGETAVGILQVGIVGAVFAFSLYRTGSLWWAIGFHAAWDWAQSYFYGTLDSGLSVVGHLLNSHPTGSTFLSGGSTGPEGSVLGIPTLALVALVIHLTLPRRDYPLTPDQTPPQ